MIEAYRSFSKDDNSYIAPIGCIDGNSLIIFATNVFYLLSINKVRHIFSNQAIYKQSTVNYFNERFYVLC